MQVAIFGNTHDAPRQTEWSDHRSLVVFGTTVLDLTRGFPEPDALVTVTTVFGSAKVIVPAGSQVLTEGLTLFGSTQIRVTPGNGPELRLRCFALFSEIKIVEEAPVAEPEQRSKPIFPY